MKQATSTRTFLLPGLVTLVILAASANAHHGNSTFDVDTVVTIEGVVIEHEWTNPHSFIHIETTDRDGQIQRITIEADGASILRPLGMTEASIQAGDRIVATASPSRRPGVSAVLGREIIKADGELVRLSVRYAREMDARAASPATSVIGSWVPDRSALFDFVAWRASWSLTDKGKASLAAYDINSPFAHSECISAPPPTMLVYPTVKKLQVIGDAIVIDADWMGARRQIQMRDATNDGGQLSDEPSAAANRAPSLYGNSVGYWDGETLIVDTGNFLPNPIGNAFGVASGNQKRLTERFKLTDSGYALEYSFVLEDPEYLVEPVSNTFQWHYRPELEPSSVACDIDAASHYLAE